MPYIQAKLGINGKCGIDLFQHENSVYDSIMTINEMGSYGINHDIIWWFSVMHDLGKANELFLSNMRRETDARDENNVCRHEISSILFIDVVPSDIRDEVALLVLSHHKSIVNDNRGLVNIAMPNGRFELSDDNRQLFNHINGIELWGQKVVEYLRYHYGIKAEIPTHERCLDIIKYYAKKANGAPNGYSEARGICMMGDHIASAYEDDTERIVEMEKLYKIPNYSVYDGSDERYPLSMIEIDRTKKHTFCTAPCGCGKTNFIMKRCTKRFFYTLPFQASINAMCVRLGRDLEGYSIGLKHGSSNNVDFIDDDTKCLSNLFGLPGKVLTPFQIMPISFCLKGYESLIMDIKGQDVIFDEVHTYNGESMTYVLELIKVLHYLGCNIHVCTATMPSILKRKILDVLGVENTQIVELEKDTLSTFNRHIVHTVSGYDFKEIKKRYENGEKILIVRNQINNAIMTYLDLLKKFDGKAKIMLIHSSFERSERVLLEDKLMNDFNRSEDPCIVVSTQVVEVSIDINFDVMFTDCADIMSLIQRFGRINRQRERIGVMKDVYVIDSTHDKMFLPYDEEIVSKTFDVFKRINGKVIDESEIQGMIDYVHNDEEEFNVKANYSSPFQSDGKTWKKELYSNTTNTSIAKILEFVSYVVIRKKNLDEYLYSSSDRSRFEIPLSKGKFNKLRRSGKITQYDRYGNKVTESGDGEKVFVNVINDDLYEEGIGLINTKIKYAYNKSWKIIC